MEARTQKVQGALTGRVQATTISAGDKALYKSVEAPDRGETRNNRESKKSQKQKARADDFLEPKNETDEGGAEIWEQSTAREKINEKRSTTKVVKKSNQDNNVIDNNIPNKTKEKRYHRGRKGEIIMLETDDKKIITRRISWGKSTTYRRNPDAKSGHTSRTKKEHKSELG
ncbi:hypothetical protein Tco_0594762 [Tanacetum coccineum]